MKDKGVRGRVLIGSGRDKVRAACEALAAHGGYAIAGSFASGREMLRMAPSLPADLALVDGKMDGGDGISVGEALSRTLPTVLILSPKQLENMTVDRSRGDRYYVGLHFSKKAILQTMEFALETAQHMEALEAQMEALRRKQQRSRNVNLAKGALMSANGMDEDTAHRHLLRSSMDSGRSLEELAEEILAQGLGAGEE